MINYLVRVSDLTVTENSYHCLISSTYLLFFFFSFLVSVVLIFLNYIVTTAVMIYE